MSGRVNMGIRVETVHAGTNREREVFWCRGCATPYTGIRGIRSHQGYRYVTGECRPQANDWWERRMEIDARNAARRAALVAALRLG